MAFFLLVTQFLAYRYAGIGGRIIKIGAASDKGFHTEYYLFIPDTLKVSDSTFLLVEPNNSGFVGDRHKKLDRDTLLCEKYPLVRIDKQLNFMIDDAKTYLAAQNIYVQDKILLNGFSASGSFVNHYK